jgi:hypothetical protein
MKPPTTENPSFIKAEASLEEELEKIFEQVDLAARKAGPVPEEFLPKLEILPDDFEPAGGTAEEAPEEAAGPVDPLFPPPPQPPARPSLGSRPSPGLEKPPEVPAGPVLGGDFHQAAALISPADDQDASFEMPDFADAAPARTPAELSPRALGLRRPKSGAEKAAPTASVTILSPEDLARLVEQAVERGVLAALKKWGR